MAKNNYGEWNTFVKAVAVCSVLSILIGVLSASEETKSDVIRMVVYAVFTGVAIMIIPFLIGLSAALFKKDQNFAFLLSWVLFAGLFLVGALAS